MSNEAHESARSYSRRRFVRLTALGAMAIPAGSALLAACGDGTAAPGTTTTTGTAAGGATTTAATTTGAATAGATTTSAATAGGATTAAASTAGILKASVPGVPDGFLLPPAPFKSTSTIPGKGGTVRVFLVDYFTPPPPRNENKFWQELEKRLGVTWDLTLSPQNSYAEKLGVLTASGDLPDLTYLDLGFAPEQQKFIQQGAYTDLTPYLSGDALKAYPNLAAFPPQLWKNAAIKGKIYGVPRPRFLTGSVNMWRRDWIKKIGLPDPKNSEDFFKLLQDYSTKKPEDSQSKTWGMGFTQGEFSQQCLFMYMFRVPNTWKLDSNGKLTYYIETPEYKQAVAYMARLWSADLIYPDSVSQTQQQSRDNFLAGKYGFWQTSMNGLPGPSGIRAKAKSINPNADIAAFLPPGHDGGKATAWLGGGYFGMAAIPSKVGKDKERVKELLGIVNYLAAPFGSEEYNFANFGIDNVHNEVKPDGTRVLNDLGRKEISELPRIANGPMALYYPGYEEQVKLMQDGIRQYIESGVDYPIPGATSNTQVSKGKELTQLIEDRVVRIVTGRDSLNALDDLIKEWKSRGGTQIAQELADSFK